MIWEVDDDLDGMISWEEFDRMYLRCIDDDSGLEPWKFYNLVQFKMFDKLDNSKVAVEDTLQILFVRYGRDGLNEEIN